MDDTQLIQLIEAVREGHPNKQTSFERHAQTVIAALITLLVGWVGFTILQVQKEQSDFRLQVNTEQSSIISSQRIQQIQISNLITAVKNNSNPLPITRSEYTIHEHTTGKRFFNLEKDCEANGDRLTLIEQELNIQ